MANNVTIRGFAVTGVELHNTMTGLVVGNLRMGSTHRRPDPVTNVWADGDTSWYRVNVFRSLAQNAVSSIHKGDRIIVVGRLHLNNYVRKDGTPAVSVEIDAESIGPDLQFGTACYLRTGASRNDANQPSQSPGVDGGTPFVGGLPVVSDPLGDQDDVDLDDDQLAENGSDADVALSDDHTPGEVVDEDTGEITKEPVPF